jgi:putative membrane protein
MSIEVERTVEVEEHQAPADPQAAVLSLTRPHPNLLKYYLLGSMLLGPFFPFALVPLFFRYHTLHYRFDEEGVSMRWGILFRREISLTYSRLQDIHLQSNLVERWLGLARVQLQTASGSAGAEMTIEGLQEFALVRDFLYSRMRGARKSRVSPAAGVAAVGDQVAAPELRQVIAALDEVALELRRMRRALAPPEPQGAPSPRPTESSGT